MPVTKRFPPQYFLILVLTLNIDHVMSPYVNQNYQLYKLMYVRSKTAPHSSISNSVISINNVIICVCLQVTQLMNHNYVVSRETAAMPRSSRSCCSRLSNYSTSEFYYNVYGRCERTELLYSLALILSRYCVRLSM